MKRIIKNLLQVFLLLLAVVGLFACDNPEDAEIDAEGNTIVKIMFHVDESTPEGQAYKKRIAAFNQTYKDRKIKASAKFEARTTGASLYETYLMSLKVEGKLPDIITFDAPNCASYANAGLLYNLDNVVPQETLDDLISVSRYKGSIYGLPIQESSAGFFYNKMIFEEAGIDVSRWTVDNPWTFDDFINVCARLKEHQSRNEKYSKYVVDMRLDATLDETAMYMLYPFIYAAGGEFVSSDGFTATGYFDSQKSKDGFNFIKRLIEAEYTSHSIGNSDFFTGKMGLFLSSGWTIPQINLQYSQFFPRGNESWGILPYPKGVTSASATGSWCFGITENGKSDKTAAKELLLWLTSAESSETITNATGMIPARKSVAESVIAPGSPEYVLYQQLLKTGKERPSTVGYPKLSATFSQVIAELKNSDVASIIGPKVSALQAELDELKKYQ